MNRELRIKHFVKTVLGCTCPDKVFEQIEEGRVHFLTFSTRTITIGGRLLIYILQVEDDLEGEKENLFTLLQAGKKERKDCGLNRFRAVLASTNPKAVELQAKLYFSQFEDKDERIHVHVVSDNVLKDLF